MPVSPDSLLSDILRRSLTLGTLLRVVVNQMDTSGKNLGQVAPTRPENYTKEELASILKFGAANIFKSDGAQAKLEELDLDDVINKAEAYETATAPTGTSLGGEDFLNQFAVQDVKADMTTWDDIIPAEDRARVSAQVAEQQAQESSGRRAAAQVAPGTYKGGDVAPRSRSSSPQTSKPAPVRKTADQRALALNDRNIRTLVRGLQCFGDIRHRYDPIVKEARLETKNRTVVTQTVDDLLKLCRDDIQRKEDDLDRRQAAGEEIDYKTRNHAVLVTFRGVDKINAETLIQRCEELKILHSCKLLVFFSHRCCTRADLLPLFFQTYTKLLTRTSGSSPSTASNLLQDGVVTGLSKTTLTSWSEFGSTVTGNGKT